MIGQFLSLWPARYETPALWPRSTSVSSIETVFAVLCKRALVECKLALALMHGPLHRWLCTNLVYGLWMCMFTRILAQISTLLEVTLSL